jgi:predicted Rossmann fold nucleotide-binding protein DprA/Smf involved in DNA uptake
MSERVAIVGTREPDAETREAVIALVRSLSAEAIVITGGARGVDDHAALAAAARQLPVVVYGQHNVWLALGLPNHGIDPTARDALIARNTLIAVACTRMVAFVRGSRGGTWDAVRQAERFRRPVEVVR